MVRVAHFFLTHDVVYYNVAYAYRLDWSVLRYANTILFCTVLYCIIQYYTIGLLYYTILRMHSQNLQ